MRIAFLLLVLAFPTLKTLAQTEPGAPIERRNPPESSRLPNAPQPAPQQAATQAQVHAQVQWDRLIRQTHYLRPEIRIQAIGDAIRCDVDEVTADEIFCTEHRADSGPFGSLFRPKEQYHVPRREIRDIRVGGRELSTLLGAGIGIGVGVGIGSINQATRDDGGQAIFALLFGGLGALLGHALPLAGHPVYEQP